MNKIEEYKLENGRMEIIDCIKGFSIFTIVLMHLLAYMSDVPNVILKMSAIGGTGVHIFFLCSGIGLYLSYLKKKISFDNFLKKRFIKIYIPYILIILLSFFLPWLYSNDDRFIALLSHVFLFKMFFPKYEVSFGMQFWFVSTIIQLYFIFIPMCKLKEKIKSNDVFFLCFVIISVIWWIICYILGVSEVRVWNSFCLQYLWEFALGFIIAEKLYYGKSYKMNKIVLLLLMIVGIIAQSSMALTSEKLKLFNDIPALIGYGSLAILLMNVSTIKKICKFLSKFSYEVFLVHIMVFGTMFHFVKPIGLTDQCLLGFFSLILSLVLGYAYSNFINKFIYSKI